MKVQYLFFTILFSTILFAQNHRSITWSNEIDIVQGVELDRGFASSYFVNDVKNFEVVYDNPYVLITNKAINSVNQIKDIIDFVKQNNRPLVIVAEEINKDVISTLVLNNIQKKVKVVVVRYAAIKFMKTGILEDLSTLTHSNYSLSELNENNFPLLVLTIQLSLSFLTSSTLSLK